jgi:hypothetical protein
MRTHGGKYSFSAQRALVRNLTAERKVLEKKKSV